MNKNPVVRVVPTVLIEPNCLLLEGLNSMLRGSQFRIFKSAPNVNAITEWPTTPDALCVLGAAKDAAVREQIHQIRTNLHSARVVVLGPETNVEAALATLQAGASGYLANNINRDVLLKALELIMLTNEFTPFRFIGSAHYPAPIYDASDRERATSAPSAEKVDDFCKSNHSPIADEEVTARQYHRFSGRELAILRCLTTGSSNKMIARELAIAEQTVKVHLKTILRKIRVNNRTQAAVWAMSHSNSKQDTADLGALNGQEQAIAVLSSS